MQSTHAASTESTLEETKETTDSRPATPTKIDGYYEWIGKEDTGEYMRSIARWREYTNNERFAREFDAITE
jgi:hypothetical protein